MDNARIVGLEILEALLRRLRLGLDIGKSFCASCA
jgi:hypothetical protein